MSLPGEDLGTDNDSMLSKKDQQKPEYSGVCASCQWFKANPMRRWTFAVMLLFAILCPIWLIIRATGTLTGDILSGLCGLALACYGANHFRILLGLKEQVDKYASLNNQMKQENAAMRTEVDKLGRAREQLDRTANELQNTTKAYAENIEKFRALDERLSKLSGDNIAGLEKLQEMSKKVQDSVQKELVQHERDILMKVQEAMEFGDDKEGLSEDEYNKFVSALPDTFQARFESVNFADVAGDDGVLDFEEFTQMADQFALLEAKSGGSK
eukprot:CAMPEP_0197025802 /NCGR_PEP_ID=MMETSP1384-20130603/6021_1 /TAXON_ID=29189 /ORGANISM="Ammonia sp." /LENGTH=269 /DNA_ID=CAMNT_0042454373 /DNA_START=88 /DNA_END=897 /DNA_ORIENTATION=-